MNKWIYKGKQIKSIKDVPECCPFIVYKVLFNDGTYYIGSKQVFSVTNPKISKKRANELYTGKGRKKTREQKVKESDWLTYQTSSKLVKERLINEKATFEILTFVPTKQEMLLTEAFIIAKQFLERDPIILNEWLSVKCFKLK